ncbi:MAG: cbb3-type cytochrome c oxidase subunit I [Acidobacteriota bacterium]|nr:cbb3-type cytochrome c oxidase subunit I [Acidobacteriota bacterium]
MDARSWWSTTDPVRIARIQLGGVLAALLLGAQLAFVLRAGLFGSGGALVSADALGGALTAHALVLVFLFALPALPLVIGGLVLPPMVGAKNFAFPALNRITLQLYLASWVLIALALLGGSVDRTLRSLPPADGGLSWPLAAAALGLHLLGLALVCGALNLLATVVYERSEDLQLSELPVLVWALVSGAAVQLAVAVAMASLGLLLFLESVTGASVFGAGMAGGLAQDPLAYERLFEFILHAGAAVVVLPAIGVAFEVLATFSRKAPAGGRSNPLSLAALAVLSLGGSGVALVNDGTAPTLLAAQSGISLLAMVPATVLLYNLLATLAGGAIRLSAAFLHALNLVVLITLGGLAGIFLATLSTGSYLQGSLFDTAQLHFLMGGGAVAGLITGLYYWWPLLTGRATSETLGRLGAALLFGGYLLAFVPSLVAGSRGLSSLTVFSSEAAARLEPVSGLGSVLLILGLGVVCWDLLASILHEVPAEPNPWGATTREWLGERRTEAYDFSSLVDGDRAREPEMARGELGGDSRVTSP